MSSGGRGALSRLEPLGSIGQRAAAAVLLAVLYAVVLPVVYVVVDVTNYRQTLFLVAVVLLIYWPIATVAVGRYDALLVAVFTLVPINEVGLWPLGYIATRRRIWFLLELEVVDVLAVALAVALVVRARRRDGAVFGATDRFVVAALGVAAIFAAVSGVVNGDGLDSWPVRTAIWQIEYLLYFVLAAAVVRTGTDPRVVLHAVVVGAFAHLAVGFAQAANEGPLGLTHLGEPIAVFTDPYGSFDLFGWTVVLVQRAGGFTVNTRWLLALVVLVFPALFVWLEADRRSVRAGALVAVFATVVYARLSDSDAALGALLVALAGVLALDVWTRRRTTQGSHRRSVVAVAAAVVHGWLFTMGRRSGAAVDGAVNGTGPVELDTFGVRLGQFRASIRAALDNPLFGVGGGDTKRAVGRYTDLASEQVYHVHNNVLRRLAGYGVPWAGAYLAAVAAVFLSAAGSLRRPAADDLRLHVALGLLTYQSLVFWTGPRPAAETTFWILAGLVVTWSAADRGVEQIAESEPSSTA